MILCGKARLAGAQVDYLTLDQWEAQKNRFRKTVGRRRGTGRLARSGNFLRDDDILVWNEAEQTRRGGAYHAQRCYGYRDGWNCWPRTPETLLRTAVELGHAIGNQHWPAVVKGTKVFVPLTVDRKVMASVMRTHAFQDSSPMNLCRVPRLSPTWRHTKRGVCLAAPKPRCTHMCLPMSLKTMNIIRRCDFHAGWWPSTNDP